MRIIISPVGTSILTNYIRKNDIGFNAKKYANSKEEEYPEDTLQQLDSIKSALIKESEKWSIQNAKNASAELNGLLSFDENPKPADLLFFIVTDTYQSTLTFEVVSNFLKSHFKITAQEIILKHLTTKNKESFLEGIKELLKWADSTLKSYKDQGYSIYFNLTGGFKSLLGYLTPVGMFYADSIFYIFEAGGLIEIPKLPIKVDEQIFSEYAAEFLLMSKNYFLDKDKIKELPDTMTEEAGANKYGLSVWGDLLWDQAKSSILSEKLIQLPVLHYERSFMDDFRNENSTTERVKLQETLAKVSGLFLSSNFDASVLKRDNGLSYENCRNKIKGQTVGHFRYSGNDRVSCIAENNKIRLLRNGFHDVCP